MSAEGASFSLLPQLPPEIWLKIFRFATFIPREADLSATTIERGLFCSYDELQSQAFEVVLPLRRTLVLVSRLFYQIGAEVLYTTFHANAQHLTYPDRRLLLFSDLLVSRPELGRFVRRLSLRWSARDEEKNYRIISHCPNVMVFSSFIHRYDVGHVPWWSRGLPRTIRSFDADVLNIPIKDILRLLEMLPYLEILHLWNMQVAAPIPPAPACLPALRILSVYPAQDDDVEACIPVFLTIQLPCLTALATNVGAVDARRSFPLEVWRRLEYFNSDYRSCMGLHPNYFHNLRSLYLAIGRGCIEPYLQCFPLRQLECLTLQIDSPWLDRVMVLPLDAEAMPMLKLFQLVMESNDIYAKYRWYQGIPEARKRLIGYFEWLVRRFEQRGVLFVETHKREICPGYQDVRSILAACKQS